jgi:hypothetical protein
MGKVQMSRHAEQEADTRQVIFRASAVRELKEQGLVERIAGSGTDVPYP